MPSTIDPLPAVPSRSTQDRTTFSLAADAFLGALPTFRGQMLLVAGEMYGAAETVEAKALEAAASAEAAAEAAESVESLSAALEAIAASGNLFLTNAAMMAAAPFPASVFALVLIDEENDDNSSIYQEQSGDMVLVLNLAGSGAPGFDDITGDPTDNSALSTALGAKLDLSGGTLTGPLITLASASGGAGFRLPHGASPSSPTNGDLWTTTAGIFVRRSGSTRQLVELNLTQTLGNKTLVMPQIDGIAIEDTYSITDGAGFAVDPANGGIQRVTLGANRTPDLSAITAGHWVLLLVDDGSAYTLTLSGVTWMTGNGSAPTLKTSGYTAVLLMHDGVSLKGWLCGDAG